MEQVQKLQYTVKYMTGYEMPELQTQNSGKIDPFKDLVKNQPADNGKEKQAPKHDQIK